MTAASFGERSCSFFRSAAAPAVSFEQLPPQLRAPRQELADQRTVEDLFEHVGQRLFGSSRLADLVGERLERIQRQRVDVGHEGHAEEHERLVEVLQIPMGHQRRAPQERARACDLRRALPGRLAPARRRARAAARRRRSARRPRRAARSRIDDRLVGRRSAEREIEEATGSIDLPACRRDLGGARQRVDAVGRALASA